MAKRVNRNQAEEGRVADNPAEAVADQFEREAEAEAAVAEDNDQAEISESGDGTEEDTASVEEVGAANAARLARGEDPVVPDNIEADATPAYDENLLLDGVGEDTQAVRQSSGRRIIDGERIVEFNASTGEETEVARVDAAHPEVVEAATALAEAQERARRGE